MTTTSKLQVGRVAPGQQLGQVLPRLLEHLGQRAGEDRPAIASESLRSPSGRRAGAGPPAAARETWRAILNSGNGLSGRC
jgi:hypothetical protein